jgi:SAM-dependent methyltransferase
LIPVYDRCRGIDNCNFSERTIWSDNVDCAAFGPHRGEEFVADGCDFSVIPEETYDFVLASHVFEHLANPLRMLQECKRVLKTKGALLIIVPDKRATFDRKRPFTPFEHLQTDFEANTPEDDFTHVDEILALHDLGLDPLAGSSQEFQARCLRNASIRAMHHHVFRPEVLVLMFGYFQMRVLNICIERPFHIVVLVEKADAADHERVRIHNLSLLGESAGWRKQDPLRRLSATLPATTKCTQSLCSWCRAAF